jgi:hypothetical protein
MNLELKAAECTFQYFKDSSRNLRKVPLYLKYFEIRFISTALCFAHIGFNVVLSALQKNLPLCEFQPNESYLHLRETLFSVRSVADIHGAL